VAKLATAMKPAAWKPSSKKIKLPGEEDEGKKKEDGDAPMEDDSERRELDELKRSLRALDVKKFRGVSPADFEKDDDLNHHIDWITAATNMRSWNYYITASTRASCRMTAGRIIPAIATTTASITGFVVLEVFKCVLGLPLESHRGCTIDLAVNNYVCGLLDDPKRVKNPEKKKKKANEMKDAGAMEDDDDEPTELVYPKEGFTCWDKVVVNKGDLTVEELTKAFPEVFHGIKIDGLWKQGITEKDVKEGKGQALFQARNPYAGAINMARMMVANKNLSAEKKAEFQNTINLFDGWAKANDVGKRKVSERYTELYGQFVCNDRNYVLLEGSFTDPNGISARIPIIKFVFKQ